MSSVTGAYAAATAWKADLLRRIKNGAEPVFANALVYLQNDPDFAGRFRFNELTLVVMLEANMPGQNGSQIPRTLSPDDISHLQAMLQRKGLTRLTRDVATYAVQYVAARSAYHPIRDWLKGLVWDGTPRLPDWPHHCLGTPDDEYHRQVGTLFLHAMVARVMRPGCKCDYTLVLEGPQGILKSAFCRLLAGEAYFSDHLPPLHADAIRVSQHMRGKWVIEISELASLLRAHPEEIKSFLTRPEEIYTPKYARNEVREPRQGVFVGTTNRYDWSSDETGNRRFWPLVPGMIDLVLFGQNREQLFAEAYHRFQQKLDWWPERDLESSLFQPQQDERLEDDPWEESVRDYLLGRSRTTIMFVAKEALEVDKKHHVGTREQRRITAILRRAGWTPSRNTRGRFWTPSP